MVGANHRLSTVYRAVSEVLGSADGEPRQTGRDGVYHDFEILERADYRSGLNRHFTKRDLRTILAAVQTALPGLNREQFRPGSQKDLAEIASNFGAHFSAVPFRGRDGVELMGFYAN